MKPGLVTRRERGPGGVVQVYLRDDVPAAALLPPLVDSEARVPAPSTDDHRRKLKKRRAVYSFETVIDGAPERVYLKLYRVRTVKDVVEELCYGRRAVRAFENGIEAERRGIPVAAHLGAAHGDGPRRFPGRSALLMRGVPHRRDLRTVLKHEVPHRPDPDRTRRDLLRALGRLAGDAHRVGLVHGDFKVRNVFVIELEPVRLALIDFDRARFVRVDAAHVPIGQVLDLRRLLKSMRRGATLAERRTVLAEYLRARRPSHEARRDVLSRLGMLRSGV